MESQGWTWMDMDKRDCHGHFHRQANFEVSRQNSVRVSKAATGENKFARGLQSGAELPIDHLGFLSHSAIAIAIANLIIIVIALTVAI